MSIDTSALALTAAQAATNIVPYSDNIRIILQLMLDGLAFDPTVVGNVELVRSIMTNFAQRFLSQIPDLANFAPILDSFANGAIEQLRQHVSNHLRNLPQNLGLMGSLANDLLAMGRANPFERGANIQEAFGSLLGGSTSALAQTMAEMTNMLGGIVSMVSGGFLNNVLNTGIREVISAIPGIDQLNSVINGIADFTNLTNVADMFRNLASVGNLAQLGSLGSLLSAPQQLLDFAGNIQGFAQNLLSFTGDAFEEVLKGGLTSLVGNFQGVFQGLGNFVGQLGGIGNILGNIPNFLGGAVNNLVGNAMGMLGNVMNGITGMIASELGALGNAVQMLQAVAGAINLPKLFGDALTNGVLQAVASPDMLRALSLPGQILNGALGEVVSNVTGSIGELASAIQAPGFNLLNPDTRNLLGAFQADIANASLNIPDNIFNGTAIGQVMSQAQGAIGELANIVQAPNFNIINPNMQALVGDLTGQLSQVGASLPNLSIPTGVGDAIQSALSNATGSIGEIFQTIQAPDFNLLNEDTQNLFVALQADLANASLNIPSDILNGTAIGQAVSNAQNAISGLTQAVSSENFSVINPQMERLVRDFQAQITSAGLSLPNLSLPDEVVRSIELGRVVSSVEDAIREFAQIAQSSDLELSEEITGLVNELRRHIEANQS